MTNHEKFKLICKKQTKYSASILMFETIVLLVVNMYLIIMLCKYFDQSMRKEVCYLALIQICFLLGFIFRTYS